MKKLPKGYRGLRSRLDGLLRRGEPKACLRECDARIERGEDGFELFFLRSTLRLILAGDVDGGWSDLKRAFVLGPRWMMSYAEAALSTDKPGAGKAKALPRAYDDVPAQAMIERLSKALAKDPSSAAAWAWRGLLQRRLGRYGESAADFAKAIELGEAAPELKLWRGEARLQTGDREGLDEMAAACSDASAPAWAHAWLGRARVAFRRDVKALADLSRALELDPGNGWFHAWRAEAGRLLGKTEKVLSDFDEALKGDLGGGDYERYVRAWKGNALLAAGRFKDAEKQFTTCLKAMPSYGPALLGRAEARLRLGRTKDWLADLEAAAAADPKHRQARFWQKPEERERARQALETMARKGNAAAQAWRGALEIHEGRFEEALKRLEEAVAGPKAGAWAWGWRGEVLARLGRSDDALASMDRALKLSPDDPLLRAARAKLLLGQGDAAAALRDLQHAAKKDRRFAFIHADLGRLKLMLGKALDATADLQRAVFLNGTYAAAWADLGAARAACGQSDAAAEAWRKAQALDPAIAAERRKSWESFRSLSRQAK